MPHLFYSHSFCNLDITWAAVHIMKLLIAKFAHAFCYNPQLGPISSLAPYCPTGTWNVQVQKHEVVCVTFEHMKETTTDTVFWNMTPCSLMYISNNSGKTTASKFRAEDGSRFYPWRWRQFLDKVGKFLPSTPHTLPHSTATVYIRAVQSQASQIAKDVRGKNLYIYWSGSVRCVAHTRA